MNHRAKLTWLVFLTMFATLPALAQSMRLFANPQNLQVLPADISPEDLAGEMRRIKLALGVECNHCHVGDDLRRYSDFDFASDAKPAKITAREMMTMVASINEMVGAMSHVSSEPEVEVNCVTCHRGNYRPLMIKDVLAASYADSEGDIQAVISRYRALRQRHHGGFAYDFGEFPVSAFAFTLNNDGHPQDAIELQRMNEEYHPESPHIPSGMGFIFQQSGQLEAAAEAFRRSLQKDPSGRWVARQLAQVESALSAQSQNSGEEPE